MNAPTVIGRNIKLGTIDMSLNFILIESKNEHKKVANFFRYLFNFWIEPMKPNTLEIKR